MSREIDHKLWKLNEHLRVTRDAESREDHWRTERQLQLAMHQLDKKAHKSWMSLELWEAQHVSIRHLH